MFNIFRRRRTQGLADKARKYAEEIICQASQSAALDNSAITKFSFSLRSEEVDRTQANESDTHSGPTSSPRIRYSASEEHDYDIGKISKIMRSASIIDAKTIGGSLDHCLMQTFSEKLIELVSTTNAKDSSIYKSANMDRRLYSKIISDKKYKPAKDTVIALIFALKLDLSQASDLLSRAGYVLSHSTKRDVVIEFFIREGISNLNDINDVLYQLDMKTIGR